MSFQQFTDTSICSRSSGKSCNFRKMCTSIKKIRGEVKDLRQQLQNMSELEEKLVELESRLESAI